MTAPSKRLVARVSDDSARMIQQDDLLDWIYKVTPQDLAADLLDARARIEELERVVEAARPSHTTGCEIAAEWLPNGDLSLTVLIYHDPHKPPERYAVRLSEVDLRLYLDDRP